MNRHLSAAFLISAVLALAGCENMGTTGSGTASSEVDPRLKNSESVQFFNKSGLQACAAGAGVGAAACLLSGNGNASCMLIAAAAGCGVGMGANYYMDVQRSKYARTEDRLDAAIADVRKDNQELQSLANTARQVISDDRKKIAQIRQDIAKNRVQKAQAEKQLAEIDANTQYLKKALVGVQEKQEQWEKVAAAERAAGGPQLKTLNAEIDRMKKEKSKLENEIDQLYAQRSAIKLA